MDSSRVSVKTIRGNPSLFLSRPGTGVVGLGKSSSTSLSLACEPQFAPLYNDFYDSDPSLVKARARVTGRKTDNILENRTILPRVYRDRVSKT